MESKEANNIPLKNILAKYNCYSKKQYSNYDMYISPFRQEKDASFKVDTNKNRWQDFGAGTYGSPVDLVMKLENCSFIEAMKILDENKFNSSPILRAEIQEKKKKQLDQSKVQILKVAPLQNKILLNYINGRGIDSEIAQKFCKEVYYKIGDNGNNCFAICFENQSGGIEYRNVIMKGCAIAKDITIAIDNNNTKCAVFEGFIDMLSYMQLNKEQLNKSDIDIIVLNSVSMIGKATEFLKKHKTIHSYIDNDKTGLITLERIKKIGPEVVNESQKIYPNQKDMNEYLQDLKKKEVINTETINHPIIKNIGIKIL